MFRKMRRSMQQLSREECEEILRTSSSGVLAVLGDDEYPYTVPLNYVYENGKILFHGAKEGHKLDAIRNHDKVSFCVIARDTVIPEQGTTAYISVIAFGRARIVDSKDELRLIAERISDKFSHDYMESFREKTEGYLKADTLRCVEITIEHLTGKAGRTVMAERKAKQAGE